MAPSKVHQAEIPCRYFYLCIHLVEESGDVLSIFFTVYDPYMIKAQKRIKEIVKIIYVTSVVQP